jgi:lysophospholipase L1-like esterase
MKSKIMLSFVALAILLGITVFPESGVAHAQSTPTQPWVGTWAASPQAPYATRVSATGFTNQTVRDIVHVSAGGAAIRLRLSNTFGTEPLTFGAVQVAYVDTDAQTIPGTSRAVTFSQKLSVTIPTGQEIFSDPVFLPIGNAQNLAISLYVPGSSGPTTWHDDAVQTNYISTTGDHTHDTQSSAFTSQVNSWFWLDGIDVLNPIEKGSIALLGASAANGTNSTPNENARVTDYLAERIDAGPLTERKSVLNEGIPGNMLLDDSATNGQSALNRINRDVFDQSGVTDVILFEANNDLNAGYGVAQIVAAYQQIITESHARGLKIFGATLQPFEGSGYYTPQHEAVREGVNNWIRTSGAFDGVIDWDAATRDPANPQQLLPAYDSGDHLHPNDAGYQAMANAVDLSLFFQNKYAH